MKNSRYYKRYNVSFNGYVVENNSNKYIFHVQDISAGGMNIITDQDFVLNHLLTFVFDNAGLRLPQIKQIKGKITRKRTGNGVFAYGIRFIELSDAQIVEIDECLRYAHTITSTDTVYQHGPLR
jgi:c-di-GMP-binding flagellar brake protein YcgR